MAPSMMAGSTLFGFLTKKNFIEFQGLKQY